MKPTQQVRDYAAARYVAAARKRREPLMHIPVREVHRALGLDNRYPLVCNALSAKRFLAENGLRIERRDGPPSGLGPNVVFTYRLLDEQSSGPGAPTEAPLSQYRGIAKEVFQSLGGGEAFIRSQRENFFGPGENE